MRGENTYEQGEAKSSSDVVVPLNAKVPIISIKNRNEAKEHFSVHDLVQIEIDKQHHHRDVDKLHNRDLLELAQSLVVLCVVLFESWNELEDFTDNYVYHCHNEGCTLNHDLLSCPI